MNSLWSVRSEERWRLPAIVLGTFLSLFVMEKVGWGNILQTQTLRVLEPVEWLGTTVGGVFKGPFEMIAAEQMKAAEIQELKNSYAQSLAQLSELENLKSENVALHQLIDKQTGVIQKKDLAAPIISYALTAIARGSNNGVQEGALIFVGDTVLGRVTKVGPDQASVTLFSSTESDPILVETESKMQGVLIGTGRQVLVTQLPAQAAIKKGERVTTVGQAGIPPGLFIGVVTTTQQTASSAVQTASVDELESFYNARLVEVR